MKSRLTLLGIFPLVLIAGNGFAQDDNRAVPRGSGGGSSSSGARHTPSAGTSSSSSDRGGSSSYDSGRSNSSSVPDAATRRPRPGTGSGTRDRWGNSRGDNRYYGSPYSYYYYDPYAYSWGYRPYRYGYGYGYWDYGYGYGDYYGAYPSYGYRSYRYRVGNIAQLRTLVEPNKARVYVDGYYAGIADDYDGLFQRLNVSPGRHEITFKLDGYKSHTFQVYANRDQTLKLRWDLERGSGQTRESLGHDNGERYGESDLDDVDEDDALTSSTDMERRDPSREVDNDSPRGERRYSPPSEGPMADVRLDVEPQDASVYVNGEFFGKASQLASIALPEGRHRIEVVRPGYKTEERDVEVGSDTSRVVVKLERR